MTSRPSTEQLLIQVLLRMAQKVLHAMASPTPASDAVQLANRELELSFGPVWSRLPRVELTNDGEALLWRDQTVLAPEADTEGLVPALAASEIYSITLLPGVEHGELARFLELVDRKRRLDEDGDQDLALQLFRAELDHIRYSVGAPSLETSSELAETAAIEIHVPLETVPAAGTESFVESFVPTSEPAPAPPESDGRSDPPDWDAAAAHERIRAEVAAVGHDRRTDAGPSAHEALHFLDASEIEYLRDAIKSEYAHDHSRNVLSLLLDVLEAQSAPDVRDEVIDILERFLPYLLSSGRFGSAAYLTAELRKIGRSVELMPRHKQMLDELRVSISEAGALRQLFQILEEGVVEPDADELGRLVREMSHDALRSVLVWMGRLSRPEAKAALVEALHDFFRQWPAALATMTASEDDAVAQRALGIAARLQMPELIAPIGEALGADASRTRRAAIAALATFGVPPALRLVAEAVQDPEADVRMAAYRTLIARPYRGALKQLQASIESTDLERRDLSERRALFTAYGSAAGAAGVSILEPILTGRGGLARRPSAETRACAAVGLGTINTPAARFALKQASSDRDPLVRSAAGRALRAGPTS